MSEPVPCRFGCREPAAEIVYVPEGCICWPDPVQALCEQHLITLESTGPTRTLLDLRTCDHKHYRYEKHGRRCTCGELMVDFGD